MKIGLGLILTEPTRNSYVGSIIIGAIRIYQEWFRPALPPSCRFTPSCSEYAVECIDRHGALRGLWLAILRLLRCHPFHPGGFDPVP